MKSLYIARAFHDSVAPCGSIVRREVKNTLLIFYQLNFLIKKAIFNLTKRQKRGEHSS